MSRSYNWLIFTCAFFIAAKSELVPSDVVSLYITVAKVYLLIGTQRFCKFGRNQKNIPICSSPDVFPLQYQKKIVLLNNVLSLYQPRKFEQTYFNLTSLRSSAFYIHFAVFNTIVQQQHTTRKDLRIGKCSSSPPLHLFIY